MIADKLGHIPPDHYWREDILPLEIDRVFRPAWICAAFTDDLQNHQDFVTTEIGPHGIVIQNFRGELKAFRNVCSHRFARIQNAACGNRPLTCPYHGWSYDAEGLPLGIPMNARAFQFDAADRAALALEPYALEVCGRFVFVCMNRQAPPLREYLGRVYDDLLHFTEVCPYRINGATFEWPVNWKIALENAAEGYHIPMAHRDSLGTTLKEDMEVEKIADHTVFYRSLSDTSLAWWQGVAKRVGMAVSDRFPHSTNYVIFPNTVVLATYGASFVLQTFEPITHDRFRLKSTYWMADAKSAAARDFVADTLRIFSEQIVGEDRELCEFAQAGVRDAGGRPPLLGVPESRVAHFQKAYARYMEASHV